MIFLWLWPATDHEPHCRHVPINKIWRWTESTPRSGWWRSHTAGIYSDCSTRDMIMWCCRWRARYEMTPTRVKLHRPATEDNYDIGDLHSDDDTDDEDRPRKRIPAWATGQHTCMHWVPTAPPAQSKNCARKISRTWKMSLVPENPGNLSTRFWNLLGNDADTDTKICTSAHLCCI